MKEEFYLMGRALGTEQHIVIDKADFISDLEEKYGCNDKIDTGHAVYRDCYIKSNLGDIYEAMRYPKVRYKYYWAKMPKENK